MEWGKAYFIQAKDDYHTFTIINKADNITLCQKLHYLQMSTEKLSKAFLLKYENNTPIKTHNVLVKFLQACKKRPEIRRGFGFEKNHAAYISYINSILDIAEKIQNLVPTGKEERLNPEYPWKNSDGRINIPAQYKFSEFTHQKIVSFQKLTNALFRIFDEF